MMEQKKLEQLDVAFERALLSLDFTKIKSVMDMLDWKWSQLKRVPETNEMAKVVRELYNYCRKELENEVGEEISNATGGFEVRASNDCVVEIYFFLDMSMGYCDGTD